ncbi:hypothetical protein SODALDRAFT_348191 [Sodiomyces alkalinus F11]|uniref:Pentatricopeptide repeat domain-containing protein n=1 Tax=Sodiomyces alkalinus (strain CBS 110278 / VKM F-3762 / F11) TaxID=1314773 RepID=A0A3N2Q9N7_SODAK|nr:hypothetical protein SODALDRAFT_348191 [Sodiomyces alkalinus F11]ROT43471.1 hypothetical protein SODALDRAFT_348191 [Sodiomyces alkalinus F11]
MGITFQAGGARCTDQMIVLQQGGSDTFLPSANRQERAGARQSDDLVIPDAGTMQALWSRGGQARICSCRGCLQATSGMIRHSATRATRRKPTFGEVFTVFYTSIMGTAAMLDAKHKDDRRKELARQLEEAKADLNMVMELAERYSDPAAATVPAGDIQNRCKGAWRAARVRQTGIAEFLDSLGDASTWSRMPVRSDDLQKLLRASGLPQLQRSIQEGKKTDYDALQRRLDQEESSPHIAHRAPRSTRQLSAQENSTRSLVVQLLKAAGLSELEIYKECLVDYYSAQAPREAGSSKERRVWQYPSYVGARGHPEDLMARSVELNRSLRIILDNSRAAMQRDSSWEPKESVAKMCHNLLVSPHPPTIHTLTTLILGFDRMGQHGLANAAVRHFLYFSKLEPTQQALVCLLNHYKEQGDLVRFYGIIQRCTGRDARGINIRRKTVEDVRRHTYLTKWAKIKDTAVQDGFINERPWFGPDVMTAFVQGLLSMDCLRQAVATVIFCWQRGLYIGSQTVRQMLDQCAHALSEDVATRLVKILATVEPRTPFGVSNLASPNGGAPLGGLERLLDFLELGSPAQVLLVTQEAEVMSPGLAEQQERQTSVQPMILQRHVDEAQARLDTLRIAVREAVETGRELGSVTECSFADGGYIDDHATASSDGCSPDNNKWIWRARGGGQPSTNVNIRQQIYWVRRCLTSLVRISH